jgi:hypothetical protein
VGEAAEEGALRKRERKEKYWREREIDDSNF